MRVLSDYDLLANLDAHQKVAVAAIEVIYTASACSTSKDPGRLS